MAELVADYSLARLHPADMLACGYKGAVRYLCYLPNDKVIQLPELQMLVGGGVGVTFVWEFTAQRALGGAPAGSQDGAEAAKQLKGLGVPGAFVYVVMEDPNPIQTSQWAVAIQYLKAFTAQLPNGVKQVGGYGSQMFIEYLLDQGLISKGWQVEGWSGSVSQRPGMCLYQRLSPTLPNPGGAIDEDVVLQGDWGQVTSLVDPPAPPVVVPTPTPLPEIDVTPADITAIANAVTLQLREQEAPGGEVNSRQKALIQTAITTLLPGILSEALSSYMQDAGEQVVREACAKALSAYNLPVNPNPPLS